jgi:hypothetical protein
MGVFETEANLSLEAFTDYELKQMIEEIEHEQTKRLTFTRNQAVMEVLDVLRKNEKVLESIQLGCHYGDFYIDSAIEIFEDYLECHPDVDYTAERFRA